MGQTLDGCATTAQAVRIMIQRSQAPLNDLAAQYGLSPKTVAKWRKAGLRAPMGPKAPRSTALSGAEEAMIVAFRKHTLLPLDDPAAIVGLNRGRNLYHPRNYLITRYRCNA